MAAGAGASAGGGVGGGGGDGSGPSGSRGGRSLRGERPPVSEAGEPSRCPRGAGRPAQEGALAGRGGASAEARTPRESPRRWPAGRLGPSAPARDGPVPAP